jgi:plastocyanin
MSIVDNAFVDPDGNRNQNASVTIDQFDTVRWTNNGNIAHTATSTSVPAGATAFDTDDIAPGGHADIRFDVVGTYTYRCTNHPSEMLGAKIIVQ